MSTILLALREKLATSSLSAGSAAADLGKNVSSAGFHSAARPISSPLFLVSKLSQVELQSEAPKWVVCGLVELPGPLDSTGG